MSSFSKREEVAAFCNINARTLDRAIKKKTLELFGKEMTFSETAKIYQKKRKNNILNALLSQAEVGRSVDAIKYALEVIQKIEDEGGDENKKVNVVALPSLLSGSRALSIEDFNKESEKEQEELNRKIKQKMRDEGLD